VFAHDGWATKSEIRNPKQIPMGKIQNYRALSSATVMVQKTTGANVDTVQTTYFSGGTPSF